MKVCWIHEDEYGDHCYDYIWDLYRNFDEESVTTLLEYAGIKFINKDQCRNEFYDLLTSWHERGLIKPKEANESEKT